MKSWPAPEIPSLSPISEMLHLRDTSSDKIKEVETPDGAGSLYVCGITPYDATHLGHANTYVHFDTLVRFWLASGLEVNYVQNVTDIDDPLLERAEQTQVDWRDLAEDQTNLFRKDMEVLNVVPPTVYSGAVESIPDVVTDVEELVDKGIGYWVDQDVYFDVAEAQVQTHWTLGDVSRYSRETMLSLFPERGGDPERPGKKDPLDPLLWRGRREGEPFWDGKSLGEGRPGWHIECSVIARRHLPQPFSVQGGGSDLKFPHHEFSAAHATAHADLPLARTFMHTGMVGLDGEKMSKSKGNLVLVSQLRRRGVDPRAIRILLLSHHYAQDWSYTEEGLGAAIERLQRWIDAYERRVREGNNPETHAPEESTPSHIQYALQSALSQNLNSPAALDVLDQWAAGQIASSAPAQHVRDVVDAFLGIDLAQAAA